MQVFCVNEGQHGIIDRVGHRPYNKISLSIFEGRKKPVLGDRKLAERALLEGEETAMDDPKTDSGKWRKMLERMIHNQQ